MEVDLNFMVGVLSIVGSIIAVHLSYVIYRYNRLSKAWLAVTLAFVGVIFRRGIGFVREWGLFLDSRSLLQSAEGVLLLVISGLYIWGLWSMKKNFENFDVVEKKTKEKAEVFDKLQLRPARA